MRTSLAVARKELRQILRDRRTLLILLFVPVFFLLLYGYALNFDIRHVPLAIDDRDRTEESRTILSAFTNSGYFDLVASVTNESDIDRVMDRNIARAVLVVPEGTGRLLRTGRQAPVQVLINGDNANTATTAMNYALAILKTVSAELVVVPQPVSENVPLISIEPRVWYNPELKSTLFLVPGLIAYIAMITAVVSTALSVVREKERGTMEQIRMSPLAPFSFVFGKTMPYFAIALISAFGIILASMVLFGLPMRGSWMLLLLAVSLFLIGALGLGLFVSTVADTQQVAFQVALLMSFLPTLMLSGFIFPISSMPAWVQAATYIVPARYFLVALRGIVLKGAGLGVFWQDIVALVVFAVAVLSLASIRLSREWA
jgi:ABC-2 type transport system permease protein